eukprot:s1909_g9.t1
MLSQQELYSSGLISYPRTEAWYGMDGYGWMKGASDGCEAPQANEETSRYHATFDPRASLRPLTAASAAAQPLKAAAEKALRTWKAAAQRQSYRHLG